MLSSADLNSDRIQNDLSDGKYVYATIKGDDVMDDVIEETVQRRRRSDKTYYYYILAIGQKALMIKSSAPFIDGTTFTGVVHKNKPSIASLVTRADTGNRELLPYYLDVDGHSEFSAYLLATASAFSMLLLLWAILRFARPDGHHISKAIRNKGYEHAAPLEPQHIVKTGEFIVTPDLFFKKGMFSTSVIEIKNITWAYMELKKKKMYLVIPAGTSSFLVLHTEEKTYRFMAKTRAIETVLAYLHEKNPGLKVGYGTSSKAEDSNK